MNSGRCLRHRQVLMRSSLRAPILAALMMFMVVAMGRAQTSTAAFQDDMRKLWEDPPADGRHAVRGHRGAISRQVRGRLGAGGIEREYRGT